MSQWLTIIVALATVPGCESYKDEAAQEIDKSLDHAITSSTVTLPFGVDPASKAGRTYMYWHNAAVALRVWKDRSPDDVFTQLPRWQVIKNQLEGLSTRGVDEDAVHAVLTQSKAITEAIHERAKAVGQAGAQSSGQNPAAGVVNGVTYGLKGRAAADAAIDNGRAEVTRVKGILIARYGMDFPQLLGD